MEVSKKDWQMFKEKLPGWQEKYMERLIAEYTELLIGKESASEKFWALEKKIRNDKKSAGVIVEVRKTEMFMNTISLLNDGAITMDDLSDFSDDFQELVKRFKGGTL